MNTDEIAAVSRGVSRAVSEKVDAALEALDQRIKAVEDRPKPVGLVGPQGEPGVPGLKGDRGDKGDSADVALVLEQLRPDVRAAVLDIQKSFMGELTTKLYAKALSAGFSTASVPRTTTKTITYGDIDGMKRPIAIEESTS